LKFKNFLSVFRLKIASLTVKILKPFSPIIASRIYRQITGWNIQVKKVIRLNLPNIYELKKQKSKYLFIDCGVNAGFVLQAWVKNLIDFDFHGFEIQVELIEQARKTNPKAIIFNKAVGVKNEEIDIFLPKNFGPNIRGGSSILQDKIPENRLFEKRKCECIDFVDYLKKQRNNGYDFIVVKMDIEGAEYPIIKRLKEVYDKDKVSLIDYLMIEFHPKVLKSESYSNKDVLTWLDQMNVVTSQWV
tara:strand:- start:1456 stop:2190 length:735 start_codon:yes stop_codon:yes gene_type:complete